MENIEENQLLQIGVNLDRAFVMKFRDYCQENDFKQRTLIRRLVEWWLSLDPINQEHIYRGRLQEVFALDQAAIADENVAASALTTQKRTRKVRKTSKAQ